MKMRDLLTRQDELINGLKNIMDKPEGKDGDLSDSQESRAQELQASLAKVKNMIKLQADIEDAEVKEAGRSAYGADGFEEECRSFSLQKAIKHMIMPKSVDAGLELEVSEELQRREGRTSEGILAPYGAVFEKRDPSVITTTLPSGHVGGNLVGSDFLANEYIDLLRTKDPLTGLGIRRLSGLHGNVTIPKANSGVSVGWVAENSAVAQTDLGFDTVTLSPKHCGAYCIYSRQMLLQSSPSIEDIIKSDLSQAMSLKLAEAVIKGTGTSNQPKGIMAYNGIQSFEYTAGTTEPMDYVPELMDLLLNENVSNVSILVRNGFKKTVDQMLTTDKLPVGDHAFYRGVPHTYIDNDFIAQNNIMLAGDFSQVLLGLWGGVEILANPFADSVYTKGNVAIRILLSADVAIRHEKAFATLTPAGE